jgi:hypothetical protein
VAAEAFVFASEPVGGHRGVALRAAPNGLIRTPGRHASSARRPVAAFRQSRSASRADGDRTPDKLGQPGCQRQAGQGRAELAGLVGKGRHRLILPDGHPTTRRVRNKAAAVSIDA